MIKITNQKQIKEIALEKYNLYYIYGKTGSGKTHFVKDLMKENHKNAFYTDFDTIIKNISNVSYFKNMLEKDFVVIDDEIKSVITKEMIGMLLVEKLKEIQNSGKSIVFVESQIPSKLEKIDSLLAKFILSGEKIEICYNIENRVRIAEEYAKKNKNEIQKETIRNIAKEKNLGKIKGKINQMSLQWKI